MRHLLNFVKYQGCGNDFIIIDERDEVRTSDANRSALARILCDRHFGVGADGLVFVESAEGMDGSMRLFEPAGNEADMCGNGLRCVASFMTEGTPDLKDTLSILTKDGVKKVKRDGDEFTADMGEIRTTRGHLAEYVSDAGAHDDSMLDFTVDCCGGRRQGSLLNTGEPHIVIFEKDVSSVDVIQAGIEVNSDKRRFPSGVNINFAQVEGPGRISVRTYERGVYDETLACGTGATACAAAAVLKGIVNDNIVRVSTRGGTLTIKLRDDGHALMAGPAKRVFSGIIEVDC